MNTMDRMVQGVVGIALSLAACAAIAYTADSRYVARGGEVYDKKTDLTWARCSIGQKWAEEKGCVGVVRKFAFDQAQVLGDGKWRVPSKDELGSLVDEKRKAANQSPTIDEAVFPDMDKGALWYWTSTQSGAESAWYIAFGGNKILTGFGSTSSSPRYAVRLVRSGQ